VAWRSSPAASFAARDRHSVDPAMSAAPPLIEHFATLARDYDALLCDVWGVIHNSIVAFPETCAALEQFRQTGGSVVLISNAPRPEAGVIRMLDRLGVARSVYDRIMTSGDVTREFVARRLGHVYHLGPERDRPIFSGLEIEFGPIETAEYVVCTGLFDDETEGPEDYRGLFEQMKARNLLMLCANPDLLVERGERLVYCAGALAELYGSLGGEVLYAGKPYRPIYDEALAVIAAARGTQSMRVLAIGDSVRTDLIGARTLGLDCLFITGGIHAEELGDRDNPDLVRLGEILASADVHPRAVMRRLVW
jgi:HAD superfamily hydrolase (TIGR01459 family)